MTEQTIKGITLRVIAVDALRWDALNPALPTYNPADMQLILELKNTSDRVIRLPFAEIKSGVLVSYAVAGMEEPYVEKRVPPPPQDGKTVAFQPGAAQTINLSLEYPPQVPFDPTKESVGLQVCLDWSAERLWIENYENGSVDWNETFHICKTITVQGD